MHCQSSYISHEKRHGLDAPTDIYLNRIIYGKRVKWDNLHYNYKQLNEAI